MSRGTIAVYATLRRSASAYMGSLCSLVRMPLLSPAVRTDLTYIAGFCEQNYSITGVDIATVRFGETMSVRAAAIAKTQRKSPAVISVTI